MITKPTVLVLGAGASIPYGFPSGQELLRKIREILTLQGGSHYWRTFDKCGITETEKKEFRQELYFSQRLSVDAFLEHRPEFLKIGKLAIALELVSHEDENILFDLSMKGCYRYLFSCLNTAFKEFDQNKLSIITFNYDRSLEHALFNALKHSYKITDEECRDALGKIPIIHVHGTLEPLPWQSNGGRTYTSNYTAEEIQAASENITIISEKEDSSPEFQRAFQLMESAERIYFLGFGYNPTNLRRLGIDRLPERLKGLPLINPSFNASMSGTAVGMEQAEMNRVTNQWKIVLPDNNTDSLTFLRRYAKLD